MRVFGQLIKAGLELLGADPAQGVQGRIWFNQTSKQVKVDDGTTIHSFQYIDQRSNGPTPDFQLVGNGPLLALDSGVNLVYGFSQGQLQSMQATLKVPAGYLAGRQISLLLEAYCSDGANAFLMAALTTLIRPGTDTFNSTANQYASTTLAQVLTGGTVNVPQLISLDLTDNTGKINGVSVAPSQVIQLQLFRQNSGNAPQSQVFSDTAQDVFVLKAMEVVF